MTCNFAAFRFCCDTGCVYFSDNFDRANSTNLGANWTETAGDWSIDTNRLTISATADAKCTCNTTHPTGSTKYLVSVSITLGADGDVARVFVNNSGQFAELERITSTCGRLRLYDGSTCKGSVNVAIGGYTRLVVCVETSKIHVGTGGSPLLTIPATATSSVVALGTAACTGTVYFEDFSLSKHQTDDATCPACGDEGCTWFTDNGCASGSLAAVDWTTTGTWAYSGPAIKCTAAGGLTIAPTNPQESGKTRVYWQFAEGALNGPYADSQSLTYSLGGGATVEVDVVIISGFYWTRARLFKGGVQYGYTSQKNTGGLSYLKAVEMCWDGTYVTARALWSVVGSWGVTTEVLGAVTDTIAALAARVTVNSIKTAPYNYLYFTSVVATKSADDVAGCPNCGTPTCTACAPDTFANTATVVISGLTSHVYGCTCTDITIPMVATSTGCQWTGTVYGPCSSGTWTSTATITESGGNYTLTVVITNIMGPTATFSNTVSTLPNCLTDFDGDVPRLSASGAVYCTMESASCTFSAP